MAFKDWFDYLDKNVVYITNPAHGGKVTCVSCEGFVEEGSKYIHLEKNDEYICEDCWKLQMNGLFK